MNMRTFSALAVMAAAAFTTPALAETLTVPFTTPDAAVTSGLYDGIVKITISGTGQSEGTDFNDAFYVYSPGPAVVNATSGSTNYFQLAFDTKTLVAGPPGNSPSMPYGPVFDDAARDIVGGIPAYNPTHDYTFELNTGVSTPTQLHFGVVDGDFADNSGAYQLTVSAAPEPSTWALMIAGVGLIGGALRVSSRRRDFAVA